MNSVSSPNWDDHFRSFIDLYRTVDRLIIAAERHDPEQKISISAVIEFRAAFTHLMRVHAAQYGFINQDQLKVKTGFDLDEYCQMNLNKALAHVYRAGYDAYDAMALALDLEIQSILDAYSQATLYKIIPDAAQRVFNRKQRALEAINAIKVEKDIENPEGKHVQFEQFEQAVSELIEVRDLLRLRVGEFTKYETELKETEDENRRFHKSLAAGWGIGGAIVGYIIVKVLG